MTKRSVLRASDSDRDLVAERLRRAAAEGRLLADELEQRLATALRARTYAELDPLVADLPGRAMAPGGRRRPLPSVGQTLTAAAITVVLLSVMAVVVMVITGLFAVWVAWAILAWWFFGRGRAGGHRQRAHRSPRLSHHHRLL